MALTMTRWIGGVVAACTLIAIGAVSRTPDARTAPALSVDSLRLRELQRRVGEATLRWEALVRRDAVLADLASRRALRSAAPSIVVDPLLPVTHRSIVERAIQRQWASLHIDSSRVPVTVAVLIDTAISIDRLTSGRGQVTHDYVLPSLGEGAGGAGCLAIVSLQSRSIVRPGTHRAFAEAVATPRGMPPLVGPCAFLGRFGTPGSEIDRWLRARSYGLAASPEWWSLPATPTAIGDRWRLANAAPPPNARIWLSPEALGCTAGRVQQCAGSLTVSDARPAGGLVMMQLGRDRHWGSLSARYVSDLATALGPERFERFWRSELPPDAALRAVASLSLDVWTHQWAAGMLGVERVGPGPTWAELAGALTLAGLSLVLAAWGWGRRQVR